jgi:hypothetical protein
MRCYEISDSGEPGPVEADAWRGPHEGYSVVPPYTLIYHERSMNSVVNHTLADGAEFLDGLRGRVS